MGNRAVIVMESEYDEPIENCVAIYLHWNGGRDSVESFLETAKHFNLRGGDYGIARLVQIICNFMKGTLSVGVGLYKYQDTNNWDNGVYVIDNEFNIVDRLYKKSSEQNEYDTKEFVADLIEQNSMRESAYS
jgi:hypothetical protein